VIVCMQLCNSHMSFCLGAESGQWEQYPGGGGSLDVCSDCVFTSVVKFFEVCVNPARVIGVFPMDAHRWSY